MNKINTINKLDSVYILINQWKNTLPNLDTTPINIIGRIIRCYKLLDPLLQGYLKSHGLNQAEFDVLSGLRRNHGLMSPTELYSSLLITSGTITHRLKLLEQRKFISRELNSQNSRGSLVRLTDKRKK